MRRKDQVKKYVAQLKDEIGRVGDLQFRSDRIISTFVIMVLIIMMGHNLGRPMSWVSTHEGRIVTRFTCFRQEAVSTPKPQPNPQKTNNTKNMQGELEVAILPDHTHLLFPGQRTIVRFCLMG